MTGVDPRVLSQLAAHDNDVEHLRQAIRAADKRVSDLEALVGEYRQDVISLKSRQTELKLLIKQIELDIADLRRQSKVHQGHLNEISDSREYRALNEEIRYIQRQIEEKEEAALTNMEELEKLDASMADAQKILAEKQAEVEEQKIQIGDEREGLNGRLGRREKARAVFVEHMPDTTLGFYERRARRQAMPVVWLWEDNACGYCHHRLTPQARLEVLKAETLVICESCGRIIVSSAPVAPGRAPLGGGDGSEAAVDEVAVEGAQTHAAAGDSGPTDAEPTNS